MEFGVGVHDAGVAVHADEIVGVGEEVCRCVLDFGDEVGEDLAHLIGLRGSWVDGKLDGGAAAVFIVGI